MWIVYAVGAAFFAGITSILGKMGVKTTPSSLATTLRTVVVLIFAGLMVAIAGSFPTMATISAKTWVFLVLSGIATGGSWLCFFRALQIGPVSKIAVIDKSSIILTVLLAIFLLNERYHLWIQLFGITLIAIGTFMMMERKKKRAVTHETTSHTPSSSPQNINLPHKSSWLIYALASAIFASLTAIFGKVGIENVEPNLGTFIRTVVVLIMAYLVTFVKKEFVPLRTISVKETVYMVLSGIATGASWLCYWKAMHDGPASVIAPIDKLSILVTIALAWIFFKEKQSKMALSGLAILVAGTFVMLFAA
ncbi:EamA family transporter [Actinotignum urinale]|uniref:EamA family transporter n=1 Tax=Actinotignum urinale TaxID=190146 RepID=UPI0003B39E19|nr:EamA family transporter [Actinotignum urinale]MDY5128450.1 EamA family transporter [Actinotignum urinale]MDY5160529.1 EamA family transporter [Actinotignum urinale]